MRRSSVAVAAASAGRVNIRQGRAADADALHALIQAHAAEGRLLPRTVDDIRRHAGRFVIGHAGGTLVACAELAPLSTRTAEVRSLVVAAPARGRGVATRLLNALRRQALAEGVEELTAFTHDPGFFVRRSFAMVPHTWVPEKIARDCVTCPLFRRCGQQAMSLRVGTGREIGRHGVRDNEHITPCHAAVA